MSLYTTSELDFSHAASEVARRRVDTFTKTSAAHQQWNEVLNAILPESWAADAAATPWYGVIRRWRLDGGYDALQFAFIRIEGRYQMKYRGEDEENVMEGLHQALRDRLSLVALAENIICKVAA